MVEKAPDVKFVLAPQGALRAPKAQAARGSGGMPRTLRNVVSSVSQAGLEFTQVKKKKIRKLPNIGIKVPDWTICPASGLKRKPCYISILSRKPDPLDLDSKHTCTYM